MRRVIVLMGLVALLALVLTACATTTPEPTAAPAAEGPAGTPTIPPDPNAPVKVETARLVQDVLGNRNAVFSTLSPDGQFIAYYIPGDRQTAGQVCIYTFTSASTRCTDLPQEQFLGYPYQLQWSADSSKLTFTENPIDLGYDADIWVMDVAAGTVANITDDGQTGSWVRETGTPSTVVDYLPMWGPTDGQIYFWRFQNQGAYMNFTLGIYRIDPAGGEPVQVTDVAAAVPASIPTFTQELVFLDGPSTISPDGKSVATLLSTVSDMGPTVTTLYNIPLDGSAPVVLIDSDTFNSAIPEWQGFAARPFGASWTSDGKGVISMASAGSGSTPFTVFYYADVAGGSVTPVVDFTGVTSFDAYAQPLPGTSSTLPARWYSPWTGGLSPKGDKLLMVNDLGGTVGLMSANLPPTGALPVLSAYGPSGSSSMASRTSRSADGKVTMYGYLLTVTE